MRREERRERAEKRPRIKKGWHMEPGSAAFSPAIYVRGDKERPAKYVRTLVHKADILIPARFKPSLLTFFSLPSSRGECK